MLSREAMVEAREREFVTLVVCLCIVGYRMCTWGKSTYYKTQSMTKISILQTAIHSLVSPSLCGQAQKMMCSQGHIHMLSCAMATISGHPMLLFQEANLLIV